ncbi:hypothetical protein ACHWQZ_G015098 [Mnemiopsis leidyi]
MSGLEVLLGLGITANAMWIIQNAKIAIFGKNGCKWCKKLKRYISKLGHDYNFQEDDIVEVDIDKIKNGYDIFDGVSKITGNNTVPQVFVDETYVGGYPEFKNMYRSKQIQKMLRPVMVNKPIAHCVDCKQEREDEQREKRKKMDELLERNELDDELLFVNNAISVPRLNTA